MLAVVCYLLISVWNHWQVCVHVLMFTLEMNNMGPTHRIHSNLPNLRNPFEIQFVQTHYFKVGLFRELPPNQPSVKSL